MINFLNMGRLRRREMRRAYPLPCFRRNAPKQYESCCTQGRDAFGLPLWSEPLVSHYFVPRGLHGGHGAAQGLPALQLDAMALAIVEAERLHMLEPVKGPDEARGGVLPAGEKHERA